MREWIYNFFYFTFVFAILSFIIRVSYPYVMCRSKTRFLHYFFTILAFLVMAVFLFVLFMQIDNDPKSNSGFAFSPEILVLWAVFVYRLNKPLQNLCDTLAFGKNIPIYQKSVFQKLFECFFVGVVAVLCISLMSVIFAAIWRY